MNGPFHLHLHRHQQRHRNAVSASSAIIYFKSAVLCHSLRFSRFCRLVDLPKCSLRFHDGTDDDHSASLRIQSEFTALGISCWVQIWFFCTSLHFTAIQSRFWSRKIFKYREKSKQKYLPWFLSQVAEEEQQLKLPTRHHLPIQNEINPILSPPTKEGNVKYPYLLLRVIVSFKE